MNKPLPCKRCKGTRLFIFSTETDASYHCVNCFFQPKPTKTPEQIALENWNRENAL